MQDRKKALKMQFCLQGFFEGVLSKTSLRGGTEREESGTESERESRSFVLSFWVVGGFNG